MKFIGHLDIMRYFQKSIRRANIPIAFSGGFSPHMIMSFAAPLGVGVTSSGEYFDMELTDDSLSSKEMEDRLNATMAEGMKVISVRQIPDGKASACMSLVAAADYTVTFREGKEPSVEWKNGQLEAFFAQDSIEILRKTKRSEKITDIKPWIYKLELRGDKVWMQLYQGSVHNLKPEYKVILVGDASMAPSELLYRGGSLDYFHSNERTGIYWLQEMHRRFPSAIWLNPMRENNWAYAYGAYTISLIREEIPMFPLTAAGLEAGIKELKK